MILLIIEKMFIEESEPEGRYDIRLVLVVGTYLD